MLLEKAEEICKENKKEKLLVISGIGVRTYYKNLGYQQDGPYVSKKLEKELIPSIEIIHNKDSRYKK